MNGRVPGFQITRVSQIAQRSFEVAGTVGQPCKLRKQTGGGLFQLQAFLEGGSKQTAADLAGRATA